MLFMPRTTSAAPVQADLSLTRLRISVSKFGFIFHFFFEMTNKKNEYNNSKWNEKL